MTYRLKRCKRCIGAGSLTRLNRNRKMPWQVRCTDCKGTGTEIFYEKAQQEASTSRSGSSEAT